jgi:hypothetical protein
MSVDRPGTVGRLAVGEVSWTVVNSSSFGTADDARDRDRINVGSVGWASWRFS